MTPDFDHSSVERQRVHPRDDLDVTGHLLIDESELVGPAPDVAAAAGDAEGALVERAGSCSRRLTDVLCRPGTRHGLLSRRRQWCDGKKRQNTARHAYKQFGSAIVPPVFRSCCQSDWQRDCRDCRRPSAGGRRAATAKTRTKTTMRRSTHPFSAPTTVCNDVSLTSSNRASGVNVWHSKSGAIRLICTTHRSAGPMRKCIRLPVIDLADEPGRLSSRARCRARGRTRGRCVPAWPRRRETVPRVRRLRMRIALLEPSTRWRNVSSPSGEAAMGVTVTNVPSSFASHRVCGSGW